MTASLRLVSWNACDAFRSKFEHLERLKPDIAVLQGVRPGCLEYTALRDNAVWIGMQGQEGLAVVGFNGWLISAAPVPVHDKWFLPAWATKNGHCINIVAVWVDSMSDCTPPTLRALSQLAPFIKYGPSIIAGDFNQSVTLDGRRGPGRRFSEVLDTLAAHGMYSAWHQSTGERHGDESLSTHYWRWNPVSKFHIDYAFASQECKLERATLGSYDQYVAAKISDHVPLIVDYSLPDPPYPSELSGRSAL